MQACLSVDRKQPNLYRLRGWSVTVHEGAELVVAEPVVVVFVVLLEAVLHVAAA